MAAYTVYGCKSWTLAANIFTGNPSGRNPAHPAGEQPNADDGIGKWKKATKDGTLVPLQGLTISIFGSIKEGAIDSEN